jgi:lysozyme
MRLSDPFPELTLQSYPVQGPGEFETAVASPATSPNRSSRDYIAWVQGALNHALGFHLKPTGTMDKLTRRAIMIFQRRNCMNDSGVVSRATELALQGSLKVAVTKAPMFFGLDTYIKDANPNPNWLKVRTEAGISFAIIQSNWGVQQYPRFFNREWPKIRQAGLVRGAYFFLRLPQYGKWPVDPALQAQAAVKTIKNLDQSDLPPVMDIEYSEGERKHKNPPLGATGQQVLDGVRKAWRVLKDAYKVAPILYTSARIWCSYVGNLPAPDLVESPLWLTPYPFSEHKPAVLDPKVFAPGGWYFPPPVPRPWGDATNWWIHQYQGDSDVRRFPGFRQVDMNLFHTTTEGATGDRVRWVQRRLGIAQTGIFDAATEAALVAFKTRKGIGPTALVDPQTFAFLCWSNP